MSVRALSDELRVIAEIELNETPQRLEDGIHHLKQWITMQPHLRAQTDDQWLAAFLRGCKHSVEKAKAKLDHYYSLRTISPDLFTLKHNDQKFEKLIKIGSLLIMSNTRISADPRVVLIRPGRIDPTEYTIPEFMSFSLICQQILYLDDDVLMVNGTINIVDLAGVTTAHIVQMTPTIMKKFHVATQGAAPLRLKKIYFINSPPMLEKLFWNIAVQLMNNKNEERDLLEKIKKYRSWLDEDMKCGTDEARRPSKPRTAADIFGVDGTFRQLEVD